MDLSTPRPRTLRTAITSCGFLEGVTIHKGVPVNGRIRNTLAHEYAELEYLLSFEKQRLNPDLLMERLDNAHEIFGKRAMKY